MTMKSFQEMENHFHENEDDQRRHHKVEHLQKSSKDHVCKVCGKRFETGNGLGGHTRIHNLLLPNKKISKQLYNPSSRDYWKDVRRLQALSVSPSQSSSSATSSSSCESSPSDLTESDCDVEKSLPSWGKKDVRGRSSTSTSSTSASSLSAYQTVPNKPGEAAKIKADETSWSDKIVKPKMKMWSNSEKARKHVCDICSKEFRTGQALGGHKSSHYYYAGATSVRVDQVVLDEDECEEEEEEASTPVTNPKTLEFDLNQLPLSEGTGS